MATNFILDTNSIYGTNSIIKKLDTLIREDVFPRNAWDTPKQTMDSKGVITCSWKIEGVDGLEMIRFTIDQYRTVHLYFQNAEKCSEFDYDSEYLNMHWIVRQEMQTFHDFYTAYFKKVDETK